MMTYQKDISSWDHDPFLTAKSMVRDILRLIGLTQDIDFSPTETNIFHPKKQLTISIAGEVIGSM
jgi:phenylalanyl-tRNA synthetase beta subunit